jgi:hypothetical protein
MVDKVVLTDIDFILGYMHDQLDVMILGVD